MTIHVFAGPSLPSRLRPEKPDIVWHEPVQAGDLLQLTLDGSDRVCIIDGLFETTPAVRHKEILLLLAEGIAIFGAASMGALRAAELRQCGMIGVGRIYHAYAANLIASDDWVALRHAPGVLGYKPLTVPLVDLAAGLQQAVRHRVISAKEGAALMRAGASIFYQDRDWASIDQSAPLSKSSEKRFVDWRLSHWKSQKTEDAVACLAAASSNNDHTVNTPDFVNTPFLHQLGSAKMISLTARLGAAGKCSANQS